MGIVIISILLVITDIIGAKSMLSLFVLVLHVHAATEVIKQLTITSYKAC